MFLEGMASDRPILPGNNILCRIFPNYWFVKMGLAQLSLRGTKIQHCIFLLLLIAQ
jgi:hypothetical protein